jgi:hypothetical protein
MWDRIDCRRARVLGRVAESVNLETVRFVLRPRAPATRAFGRGGFGRDSAILHGYTAPYQLLRSYQHACVP